MNNKTSKSILLIKEIPIGVEHQTNLTKLAPDIEEEHMVHRPIVGSISRIASKDRLLHRCIGL